MLSVADALRAVLEHVPRFPVETISLAQARGRVLASDIVATRQLPGFDNSAMDGFAARSHELPATVQIAGVVAAGQRTTMPVSPHSALRIFTGAPLPAGLDTMIIQEDAVVLDGERVTLPASPPGENIRRAGEDIEIGEKVLTAGTRLGAWDLGVLAALGVGAVTVARAPRVALIATGDELVDVSTVPKPGQLVDSSMYALAALVEEAGGVAHRFGIARDELAGVTELIRSALDLDVVITTGGVSVGERDHVRAALANAGVALALWKVAMKPGKPFAFGMRPAPESVRAPTPVFGLPGNPVSTLVAFELFVRPALLAMQGAGTVERPRATVRLGSSYSKQAGRAHYLRASVVRDDDQLVAHAHPKQGSAMLSSLVGCNALVELAAESTDIPADTVVPAILLEAV